MYLRRLASRAITSPATSFLSKSRSITTSSPFIIRPKQTTTISPICRRFVSNDVAAETQSSGTESTRSVGSDDQSSIASAVPLVSDTISSSTYGNAESLSGNTLSANDEVFSNISRASESAGFVRRPRISPPRNDGEVRGYNREYQQPLPTSSVYVGNLLFQITEEDLKRAFSEFGEIKEITVARDARGLSKGYAYIEFDSIDTATAVIKARDQTIMEGRRLVVGYQAKTSRANVAHNPPSKTIFIGNLAFEMSDADLNKLFKDIRNVIDVRVAIDRRTGQPRGFAHADFVDVESAVKGLEYLQGKEFYGRALRVDYASSTRTRSMP